MPDSPGLPSAAVVARQLASKLEASGEDYALGGAIAFGFWGTPRGTVDVDLTLFLPPNLPARCMQLLDAIGCEFREDEAEGLLKDHGYCHVSFLGVRVDIFLPIVPFYDEARKRRVRVNLGEQAVMVWSAEVLCVFKMMFFRRKDLADAEDILRVQGERLEREWVRSQLLEMYGKWDPRLSRWDELCEEVKR